jgi:hypothetical protein
LAVKSNRTRTVWVLIPMTELIPNSIGWIADLVCSQNDNFSIVCSFSVEWKYSTRKARISTSSRWIANLKSASMSISIRNSMTETEMSHSNLSHLSQWETRKSKLSEQRLCVTRVEENLFMSKKNVRLFDGWPRITTFSRFDLPRYLNIPSVRSIETCLFAAVPTLFEGTMQGSNCLISYGR